MRAKERGFTLLETLVAMFVLTMGIFGLYSLQITSMRSNTIASTITEASNMNTLGLERLLYAKISKDSTGKEDGLRVSKKGANGGVNPCFIRDAYSTESDDGWNAASTCLETNNDYKTLPDCKGLRRNEINAGHHCFETDDGRYIVFYNVAANWPAKGVKTIRAHAYTKFRSERNPVLRPITYEMIRNDPEDPDFAKDVDNY